MIKKSISASQRKKDPHAGPGDSFPLDAEHLKAAWDLAGHAANPDAVRAKIKAYARAHGMENLLPKTAQAKQTKKARSDDMASVMQTAYHLTDAHSWERQHFLQVAHARRLLHHLPGEAHTDLHEFGIPHNHPDMQTGIRMREPNGDVEANIQQDPDDPAFPLMHDHIVSKAFNPKAVTGTIVKSWAEEDDQIIEGWMATNHRDLEKDITEPDAFAGGPLKDYFARSAPLSLEHGTDSLPAGHLQKAAIIKAGQVLESADHPTDASEFTHLPTTGDGVWVRARVTEEPAKSAIRKGNVGGMSFIGNFTDFIPLPGGGKRFLKIDPLIESTVAAYPINPKAAFQRVQKALGLSDQETSMFTDEGFDFDAFLDEAKQLADARTAAAESQVQKSVSKEDLGEFANQLLAKVDSLIEAKIEKASVPARGEGVGRKGTTPAGESTDLTIDSNPLQYLIQKAEKGEELSDVREKQIAWRLWSKVLSAGMPASADDLED